jgi:pantoate--beta-alanine ligase
LRLAKKQAISDGLAVDLRLDYLELNDAATFDVLDARQTKADSGLVILSGALYVDKTRLIDNILLDQTEK